ncbi:MAG: M28 family peptidase [Flavobacteriaceae bacterium]
MTTFFKTTGIILLLLLSIKSKAQTFDAYYDGIVNNVSATNILNDLTTFENYGIKSIGTTALSNTQNWIKGRYQAMGFTDIVEQPFDYNGGTTNNIIVTKIGSVYPNTFLIIDAHYDTLNGPGTNDNGSGTVLLLEIARLLQNVNTEYSIKFIHFSGEEPGLLGSNYYVNNTVIPQNLDIKLVLNIDQVGGVNGMTNNTIICERDTGSPSSNNAASDTATSSLATCIGLYSNLQTEISYAYASDYMPFENNGEIITGLYEKNETPYGHTSSDLLINMDPAYLTEVTKGALGAALYFAVGVQGTSAIGDDILADSLLFFPNPSDGFFQFKNEFENTFEFTVFNVFGKTVHSSTLDKDAISIDLSLLGEGIYFCLFTNENNSFSKKIMIAR